MKEMLAWVTTNYNCNLRCGWCYQRELAGKDHSMPKELAHQLIDFLSGLPLKVVILIGGEPTLYPSLFDVIRYIKDRGLRVDIVTNSIKFSNQEFLKQTLDTGLDSVVTSLKGTSTKEYAEATGSGAFTAVDKAIRNLEASGVNHRISVTVSRSIISNWESMIEFIKSSGTKDFTFSFEKPAIFSEMTTFDETMMPRLTASFIENKMYPTLLDTGVKFKIELLSPHCVYSNGFVEKLEKEGHAFGGCMLLRENGIVFDPFGQVLPCNHFVTSPLGKFGTDFETPEEYFKWLQSSDTKKFYKMITSAPGERCASCEKWQKCGAGCRLFWLYRGAEMLLPNIPR